MATAPSILYQNLLAEAADGRGDGTIYAWGTSATVDQANKQFDLTTMNIMTDLGADADDKFNGYVLVFTSSGRSYLITDWVAATDLATVFETPNTTDTGAWTIRRTLYTNDFATANPIRYAANGRLYQKWIDASANNTAQIDIALPNLIDDGGFEKNSLTDYWTTRGVAGTGTVAINATTPILGSYDCKFNQGDQTYVGLEQATKGPIRKGYTYGIIMKTGGDAGAVTDFRVSLEYVAGSATRVPVTFTEINAGDDTATANIWKPAITDANTWDEIIFTVSEDIDTGACKLVLDQYDATDVFIDEIYLWEIGPTPASGLGQPDTFIIGNHNMAGGVPVDADIWGSKIINTRTSGSPVDWESLLEIDKISIPGNTPVYSTWTQSTTLYPIFSIYFNALASKTWEAGEIWIGQRWDWDRFVANKWTPHDGNIEVNATASFGGVEVITERYRKRRMAGGIPLIDDAAFTAWKQFIAEVGVGGAFWYYMQALTDPITDEEIMLMRNAIRPVIRSDMAGNLSVDNFSFIEMF